jgi:hypothetical protein
MALEQDIVLSTVGKSTSLLDQRRMPFLESLVIEKGHQPISFHMSGHKGSKTKGEKAKFLIAQIALIANDCR